MSEMSGIEEFARGTSASDWTTRLAAAIAVRLDVAKAAIGYEKPCLAAIEEQARRGLTLEELVLQAHAIREERNDSDRARQRLGGSPAPICDRGAS